MEKSRRCRCWMKSRREGGERNVGTTLETFVEWQQSTLLAPSFKDEDEMTTGERTNRQGEECLSYPFTKCRGQATKSIAYRFPRTQRLPNRSETILMAG
ncbi:uncharacterized protein LOC112552720 isoform X2 [Pogonomyrmex barbatus]|uniref:Uncharacterized protein LOC112552720 isoform X2 n=1 Tax=Pogonomyrmex barbatus TaxID=144034 RepID=A0A8N1S645_9HYME|nr:uncharacterized protein LOC112552720 isoform X2 [Pogonomyrmex barbatus]